jgi:hypothetical protein
MDQEDVCAEILKIQNGTILSEKVQELRKRVCVKDDLTTVMLRCIDTLAGRGMLNPHNYRLLKHMRENSFFLHTTLKAIEKESRMHYWRVCDELAKLESIQMVHTIKSRNNIIVYLRQK